MPEANRVSHEEMHTMVVGSFAELEQKGFFKKLWSWCRFFYTSYGYSSVLYNIYFWESCAF